MHRQLLAAFPGLAHDRRLADVGDPFDDVQFAEPVAALSLIAHARKQYLVLLAHVLKA